MAMNNDNLNELLEGLNKKQKKMKEVDEQLSSTDIEIEYYKAEIEAEMTKDLKMKECKLKEKWRTVAELKTALGGVNHTDDLPSNHRVRFTPNHPVRFTPPSNRPILSKFSNAHNIILCFTKVFSAKDQ